MIINYPDGRKRAFQRPEPNKDRRLKQNRTEADRARDKYIKSNMGMAFEADVTKSCEYYREKGLASIYKRPTPIRIVRMSKSKKGMIEEAYFEEKSTTDYVGIYKGRYIDFECKETIHESIPYHMIREQQYRHLEEISKMGGIGFFLVSFKSVQEVYLIDCRKILREVHEKKHPGFKRSFFAKNGTLVRRGYNPPYYLLEALEAEFGEF